MYAPGDDADPTDGPVPLDEWYDPDTIAALDAWSPPVGPTGYTGPSRLAQWGRTTAMGAVLTGIALGYQQVFEPKDKQAIVIEVDDAGEPHDLPIQLFLDPDDPSGSLCVIRRTVAPPTV